jgi:hypothetical protein
MRIVCPSCGSEMSSQDLRTRWGGGSECPNCSASLRWSPPYHMIVLWGSSPILIFLIATKGIREGLLPILAMALEWLIGSIIVAILVSLIHPPKLKLTSGRSTPPTLLGK